MSFVCVNIFFSSAVQSVPSKKTEGHLLLVRAAAQMVPPANHPVPPAKVYSYWKQCLLKLYRVNPISLRRAWRFQFLCSWVLWWPRSSLRLRTRGTSDLGTVPGLLFGLLPSNLWSRRLCAELWLSIGRFSLQTPAPGECLCRHRCETRTFSWGCKGFSVLIPARAPL